MGSSLSTVYDDMEEERIAKDLLWLEELAEKVKSVPVTGSDFLDLKWMVKNREKILRMKKVIELVGCYAIGYYLSNI